MKIWYLEEDNDHDEWWRPWLSEGSNSDLDTTTSDQIFIWRLTEMTKILLHTLTTLCKSIFDPSDRLKWLTLTRSTKFLTMSALCQLLGWILNLYGCSFICECMLCPLLFLFLLQLIRLSMQLHVLLELLLQHMQLLLCSMFCLRVIFMSCCHFIARVSKVPLIINGPAWACNLVPPPCCQ